MKRYDFWDEEGGQPMLPEPEEHGRFVYFQEAQQELTAANTELEHQRAERVQLETLSAARADEIHLLNNQLTQATLERDALLRGVKMLEVTWKKLLETGL
jgi:hypothetical protein